MRVITRYAGLKYVIPGHQAHELRDSRGMKYGKTTPLRVHFSKSANPFFDSESIADPEKRQIVEDFLMNHPERGVWFHIEDAPRETVAPQAVCIAKVVLPGEESRLCGKPVKEGSDYCEECAEQA
jgi:hypothetical protein